MLFLGKLGLFFISIVKNSNRTMNNLKYKKRTFALYIIKTKNGTNILLQHDQLRRSTDT